MSGAGVPYLVLCVDDEELLLDLCRLFLERSGILKVDTATSAVTALEILKEKEYDRAQELFIQVSELDRSNFMALNEAGTILLNHRKDYFNALRCFKKAYELLPLPVIKANISLAENFLKGVTK